jgi:hypothetical protein
MYLTEDDCRLADLVDQVSEKTDLADYPLASDVEQNVLSYDSARLHDGPGIVVFTGAFGDAGVVDLASRQFEAMIAAQRTAGGAAGDHFAQAGQNDRIWNALEKLALRCPRRCSRPCGPCVARRLVRAAAEPA